MATTTQTREHAGHSHNHNSENVYLTSTDKNDAGVRITRIGLFVNLGMAIGKGVGGYVFHSQALSADAIHSLTDLVSDFMTLATVSWALRPPTQKFPFGYGKIESLGSLGVSSILLFGGLLMGWSAALELCHIYAPAVAEAAEWVGLAGHSHGHTHEIPNIQAAWLAGGSIVVKEWLYHATLKVAKERKSSVLESNAVHHRVDSLTSIAALVSIAASNIFPTLQGFDSIGGLLITYLVVKTGWENTWIALEELADARMPEEVQTKSLKAAKQAVESKTDVEVRNVQGIKAGQNYIMEVEVAVPGRWTLEQTRSVEQAVRERVGAKVRGARRVRVRFTERENEETDFMDEFISPSVSARSSPEPEGEHDEQHDHGHTSGANQHDHGVHKRR